MASVRGAFSVLNGIYLFIGILGLLQVIQQTYSVSKYSLNSLTLPVSFTWVIVLMIFLGFYLGRKAMEEDRADKLQWFAGLVFACLVLQIAAQIYMYTQTTTTVGKIMQRDFIAKYDTLPKEVKDFVQKSQQEFHCCGMFGWTDYGKPSNQVPGSCCGRYSPSSYTDGQCTKKELEQVPGCKDQLYEIMRKSVPNGLFLFLVIVVVVLTAFTFGFQLALSILAMIHSRRLREIQSGSRSKQNLI